MSPIGTGTPGALPFGSDRAVVAPSLLSADFAVLADEIEDVRRAGAEVLHLDVMDGHFVDNLTFGPLVVRDIRRRTGLFLDCHLMIRDPARYWRRFAEAGANLVSFHIEVVEDPREILDEMGARGLARGLALNPDTPLEQVEPYLDRIELLLLMTVFPGFGGQEFIAEALDKIREAERLRRSRGNFVIEVDGGISQTTAPLAVAAGARVLVAGSAVFGKKDRAAAIAALRDGCGGVS